MASPGMDGGGGTSRKSHEEQPANRSTNSTSGSATAQKDHARSSKKSRRRPAPGSWSCPDDHCDTLNSARRTECKVCGAAKPGTVLDVGSGAPRPPRDRSTTATSTEHQATVNDGNNSATRTEERNSRTVDGGSSSEMMSADERPKGGDGGRQKLSSAHTKPPTPTPPTHKPTSDAKRSARKRPAPGSWPCPLCQTLNSARRERCKACNKLKPEPRDGGGVMLEGFGSRASSGRGSTEEEKKKKSKKKKTAHGTSDGNNRSRSRSRTAEQRRRHNTGSRSRSTDGDRIEHHQIRSRSTDREPHPRTSTSSSTRWTCRTCTVLNSDKRSSCKACRTAREGGGDSTSKKRQDSVHSNRGDRHQQQSHRKRSHRSRSMDRDDLRRQESRSRNAMSTEGQQVSDSLSKKEEEDKAKNVSEKIAENRSTSAAQRTKSCSPSPLSKEKNNTLSRSESRGKQSRSKSRRDGGGESRERLRRSDAHGGREKSTRRRRSHYSKSPSSRGRSESPNRSNRGRSHHSRSRSASRERLSNRRRSHHSRSPSRDRNDSMKRSSRRRSHLSRSPSRKSHSNYRRRSHHSRSRSESQSRSRSCSPGDQKKPSRRECLGRSKSDERQLRSRYRRSKSGRRSMQTSCSASSGTRSEVEMVTSNIEVAAPSALEIANAFAEKEVESNERRKSLPKSGSKCDLYLLHSMVAKSPNATADAKASRDSMERRASIDHISLVETPKPLPSAEDGVGGRSALFGDSTSFISTMDLAGLDNYRRASMELAASYKSEQILSNRTANRRASMSIVPLVASKGVNEGNNNVQSTKANRHASMDFVPASWSASTTKESIDKNAPVGKVERRPAPGSWNCPNEECGKLNSARRIECKICGTNKPKQDADERRSKSRRSKNDRRHRSKSRSSSKKDRRAPTSSSSKEKKSTRGKIKGSGDDTDSAGSKSDGDYNNIKHAAGAIVTAGVVTTATAQEAAAGSSGDGTSSEKKDADSKQVTGKDADNSTGTATTTASSPQSSSKTNDEGEQKQLLDKEDGVQMTSRVDRRIVMRGSRARRSMMALFDSQDEIVVLTPATLQSNFSSTIRQKTRGPAKYAAFASAFFVVVFVVLLAAFFEFAPLPGVPIWQPVLAIGNQLIESVIETTLYIMAVYLIIKNGAVLALYFVRHCGLYVGMVCIAYAIADTSLLVKYGSGGADDGAERWARVALSACLGVSSMTTAVLLQARICTRIELRALNSVTGETDDEIALYLKKDRHLTADEMRKKREGIKDWYHRTMYIAVLGYQVLAVMIPLASSVWYLLNDVGSLTEFNLCRYTTSRCVDITIRPNALVDKDVEIKWDLQNGSLILSILETIGAFSHDAFVLATFSTAALFPHKPGSVGIAVFAAFGKLSLAIGYLINLLLLWTSDSLDEGLVWSMCFAFLDIACASLVLVACFRFTPTLRRAWRTTLSDNEVDELSDSRHKRLGCKTLRSIAFSAQQLLNPKKKKWAKALFISTLSVFLLDSLQGILVLIKTTRQHGNTYIAETFKFSMHICLFYAFVNYFSVSDRGKHFYKSRRVMGAIAACGVAVRSWQMAQMVVESEKPEEVKPTTGTDRFVQSILAFDVLANLALLASAFAISDLDLSQKSTRRLSNADCAPVAVESGDAKVDSRTQLLLAKMVEGDLRQRARNVFCLYLISLWTYSMSLAIFDGLNSGTAPYLTATFDNTLDNMLAASVALTDTVNQQEMTTRRSLFAITPRLRPFVFVLAVSRPGLEIFFHYGLVFSIFCFDGLRKKPRKRYSLVTAGTFAFHAFALLLVFLIAMTYSSVTSSDALTDFENVGEDDGTYDDDDVTSTGLLGVASGIVRQAQEDHSAAEIIPFLCLVVWFMFLIPMGVTLHMLWKGRRRIHNIVSGGETSQNTDRCKSGDSVDIDLEAAITADIETRALLSQPEGTKGNEKDGGGASTRKKSSNNGVRKESSERNNRKEKKEASRSRMSKRSSTKKERRKGGEHTESSRKKRSKANDKASRTSKKDGRQRPTTCTLEADSTDDRGRDGEKKLRSSKKTSRKPRGGSRSKSRGRRSKREKKVSSTKRDTPVQSKAEIDDAKTIDDTLASNAKAKGTPSDTTKQREKSEDLAEMKLDDTLASNAKAKGTPSDTTKQEEKPEDLAEMKKQHDSQGVPKKEDGVRNMTQSNEKQATGDVKDEENARKESIPPTGGELV